MIETKKIIEELKKKIEEMIDETKEDFEDEYNEYIIKGKVPFCSNNSPEREYFEWVGGDYLIDYDKIQAQLQFAEKLMKLRDKEEEERRRKLIEKIKKDIKERIVSPECWSSEALLEEINKILDDAK